MPKLTIPQFKNLKNKRKIAMVTCYDFSMAKIIATTNIDSILVGDSLGMVIKGEEDTLNVEVDEIIYHAKAVKKGAPNKLIIVDMPFMSYYSMDEAFKNASKIIKKSGADAIKIEGVKEEIIKELISFGIPIMGLLGLPPQSVKELGGF